MLVFYFHFCFLSAISIHTNKSRWARVHADIVNNQLVRSTTIYTCSSSMLSVFRALLWARRANEWRIANTRTIDTNTSLATPIRTSLLSTESLEIFWASHSKPRYYYIRWLFYTCPCLSIDCDIHAMRSTLGLVACRE